MKETKITAKLRKIFSNSLYKFYRLETGSTACGIPDCYYEGKTVGWIELKQGKILKNGNIVIKYRPRQKFFLLQHRKNNHNAFTLLSIDQDFYLIYKNFKDRYENKEDLNSCCVWKGGTKNLHEILDYL